MCLHAVGRQESLKLIIFNDLSYRQRVSHERFTSSCRWESLNIIKLTGFDPDIQIPSPSEALLAFFENREEFWDSVSRRVLYPVLREALSALPRLAELRPWVDILNGSLPHTFLKLDPLVPFLLQDAFKKPGLGGPQAAQVISIQELLEVGIGYDREGIAFVHALKSVAHEAVVAPELDRALNASLCRLRLLEDGLRYHRIRMAV